MSGLGRPNLSSSCIQIHDCGPDGICGNGDDRLLGTGGTSSNGTFTITVSPALICLEKLYPTDVCDTSVPGGRQGPVFPIVCPPAPLMSPALVLLLAATLGVVGLFGLRRTYGNG